MSTEPENGVFGINVGKAATGGVELDDFIYFDATAGKAAKATSAAGAGKVMGLAIKDVDPTLGEGFDDVVVATTALVTKKADAAINPGEKVKVGTDTKHVAKWVSGTDGADLIVGWAVDKATAAEDEIEVKFAV